MDIILPGNSGSCHRPLSEVLREIEVKFYDPFYIPIPYTKGAINRFLTAYREAPEPYMELEHDENLHIYMTATFGKRAWAGQVVFSSEEIAVGTIENFDHQCKFLLAAARRRLLKEGIIND